MADKKKVSKTTQKVTRVIQQAREQAKESLKLVELLEREAVSKARTLVKIPSRSDRKKLTNDTLIASLRKLGVATQSDLNALRIRVEQLEAEIALAKGDGSTGSDALPRA